MSKDKRPFERNILRPNDPYKTFVTNVVVRRPYDARADAMNYIMKLKKGEEGMIPPAVGIKILERGALPALRELERDLKDNTIGKEIRDQAVELANQLRDALETSIEASLYEVGIDAEALHYTAQLNAALIAENKSLKRENNELREMNGALRIKVSDQSHKISQLIERNDKTNEKIVDATYKEFCNQMWPFFEDALIDDLVKELWGGIREDILKNLRGGEDNG